MEKIGKILRINIFQENNDLQEKCPYFLVDDINADGVEWDESIVYGLFRAAQLVVSDQTHHCTVCHEHDRSAKFDISLEKRSSES